MATREVIYAKGEAGYEALVADFKEMFDWDTNTSPTDALSTDTPYTDFKKSCGDNIFVSLRVMKPTGTSAGPRIVALVDRDGQVIQSSESLSPTHCAYSYGKGFFLLCLSNAALPHNMPARSILGISSCRNIITGESGWLTFYIPSAASSPTYTYNVFSKDTASAITNNWSVSVSARIGGAVLLHESATGCVSDKIMLLSAIPDTYTACMNPVIFNGTPYIRLGHLLVPTT